MLQKTLRQLYENHNGNVSDKWSLYIDVYEELFTELHDKEVNILEIGIQNGGSIEIISKYFRNGKFFIGCDINEKCKNLNFDDERINIVIGDANINDISNEILSLCNKFDIIIDDGSHRSSDIVKSFSTYFPYLSDEGTYIIEDLHCSYWQQYEGGLFDPLSSISFFKLLIDVVNCEHWGVPMLRKELLKEFYDQYGLSLSEEDLSQIYSVEFFNSICVIRKSPKGINRLGKRIIAGQREAVVSGLKKQDDFLIDESQNPWSARSTDHARLTELAANLQKLQSSFSHKIINGIARRIRAMRKQ